MRDFYHRRINLLVASTIIENGIDVPTANTIIINRADKFGLAQLHQLRGRVGRSHHLAYAYLVTPPWKAMTTDARKRLEAIQSLQELGAGFTLATHDLEIRGAGELLGEDQSGQIEAIGFQLYSELLNRTVEALKAGVEPDLDEPVDVASEVDLHTTSMIPSGYLPDVHQRLVLYKRIAQARTGKELHGLQVEMIDRFGLLPEEVKNLFIAADLRLEARALGIRKLEVGPAGGRVEFLPKPDIDMAEMIRMIQKEAHTYSLPAQDRLRVQGEFERLEDRIAWRKPARAPAPANPPARPRALPPGPRQARLVVMKIAIAKGIAGLTLCSPRPISAQQLGPGKRTPSRSLSIIRRSTGSRSSFSAMPTGGRTGFAAPRRSITPIDSTLCWSRVPMPWPSFSWRALPGFCRCANARRG